MVKITTIKSEINTENGTGETLKMKVKSSKTIKSIKQEHVPKKEQKETPQPTESKKRKLEDSATSSPSKRRAITIGKQVFLGGLCRQTTQDTIKKLFSKYGNIIEIGIPIDNKGYNKGYAFVSYNTNDGASTAVNAGSVQIDGKKISIKLAVESERKPEKASRKIHTHYSNELYMSNLEYSATVKTLNNYFSKYGKLTNVTVPTISGDTSRNRGFAYVAFESEDSLNAAVKDKHKIEGRHIMVEKRRSGSTVIVDNTRQKERASRKTKTLYSNELFVSHLEHSTTEKTLNNYFSKYGKLTKVVVPTNSGEKSGNRGFAFVAFESEDSLNAAIKDKHMIDGRHIVVNKNISIDGSKVIVENTKQKEKASRKTQTHDPNEVYISNLEYSTTEKTLNDYFSKYGKLTNVTVPTITRTNSRNKGFAFVAFESEDSLNAAIKDKHMIDGRHIVVNKKRSSLDVNCRESGNEPKTGHSLPSKRLDKDRHKMEEAVNGKAVKTEKPENEDEAEESEESDNDDETEESEESDNDDEAEESESSDEDMERESEKTEEPENEDEAEESEESENDDEAEESECSDADVEREKLKNLTTERMRMKLKN